MNKVISVYELLGLIKDGKPPKKIIYDNKKYFIEVHDYSLNDEKVFWLFEDNNIIQIMTKKVEIIEEEKVIEKLGKNFTFEDSTSELTKSDWQVSVISQKINELVDEINKLKREK